MLTTRIAALHFAPTPAARDTLLAEGIPAGDVFLTGNTVIDALLQTVRDDYRFRTPALAGLDPRSPPGAGDDATAGRASARRSARSARAMRELAGRFPDVAVRLPVHPNPKVKRDRCESLLVRPPGHAPDRAGGLRRVRPPDGARATSCSPTAAGCRRRRPSLGKPVLVLREVTERPEGVAAGTAMVVGTDRERIVSVASELLTSPEAYARMANAVNPYGDGRASERIIAALGRYACFG